MKFKEITSHEIACKVLDREATSSIRDQLDDIADAINKADGEYVADFNDSNQLKWRPFFLVDSSGFRFGGSVCDDSYSSTIVGSRLCYYFRTEEAADFFGKQFEALHKANFFYKRSTKQNLPMNFKDINSHEAACKVLEKDPALSTTTDQKITDIFKAANKLSGFVPDFNKGDQYKWRPFFIMDTSGFRFAYSDYGISASSASVGSRLCHYVGSREEADHLGTQFIELHKAHYFGE